MKCLSRDAGGSWDEYLYSAFESEPHIRIISVAWFSFSPFVLPQANFLICGASITRFMC